MRWNLMLMAGSLWVSSTAIAVAQCESGSSGQASAAARGNTAAASSASSAGSRSAPAPTAAFRGRRTPRAGSLSGIPQVTNPFPTGMGALQAFQAQQIMAQRLTAASAVRNRRTAARQQQMLAANAQRAYDAALNAEKSGRLHTARQRYERAANIAPGSIAAQYAEEAMARLRR